MKSIAEKAHILNAECKYPSRAAGCQLAISDERIKSVYPRQRINRQDENVFEARIKPIRLAIACLLVLVIADLLPHPALSPGFISTSLSEIKQVLQENIH
ncbi:MAG: hypothetical protein F6K42_04375 [Leptolyngbya sp. SIO1D8]|nr:hypothetical protein [Leptolyngbya sp. SIO1D8]